MKKIEIKHPSEEQLEQFREQYCSNPRPIIYTDKETGRYIGSVRPKIVTMPLTEEERERE